MSYFTNNWGHPLIAILGVLVISVHSAGLTRFNRGSTLAHAKSRRRRLRLSYLGIVLFVLSACSPLEYWSMVYFWVHMLQHIVVMLAAPAIYVAGRPLQALLALLPVTTRRRFLRAVFLPEHRGGVARVVAIITSPWTAVLFFNAVMVVWMIPAVFNPVMANQSLHVSLMLTSFFLSGVLFWLQLIPSRPLRPRLNAGGQIRAVLGSNLIMTLIAISISILTTSALYTLMATSHADGAMHSMSSMTPVVTTLNPLADQQIGAAILWVCGDFWAFPIVYVAFRRLMAANRLGRSSMDKALGRSSVTTFRGIKL